MSLIDVEYFKQVSLHNSEFALEIIERFLQQAKSYQQALSEATTQQDFWGVKQIFQQLKAQATVFGATPLVKEIRRIEIASISRYSEHEESIKQAEALFNQLLKEIEEVKPQFQ